MFLGVSGTLINLHFETQKRDQNLQNVAEAIAQSPILSSGQADTIALNEYLDSLQSSLDNIDVISVVNIDNVRLYHSNHELIGSVYDGTLPKFDGETQRYYATNDSGPSGTQRRAYAAILLELLISKQLSGRIKKSLMGNEPAVAALLIGKTARAAEQNVKFAPEGNTG